MDYEYVAVKWITMAWCDDRGFVSAYARLREHGWEEHSRAQFEKYVGGACIMRRPKDDMRRPKDDPRLWTERDIQELIYVAQWKARAEKEKYAQGHKTT